MRRFSGKIALAAVFAILSLAALQRPEVREQMERQAFESSGSTPEQLGAYTKEQIDVWKRITRELGLKPQ